MCVKFNALRINEILRVLVIFFLFIYVLAGCKLYTAIDGVFNPDWEEMSSAQKGEPRIDYRHDIPIIHLYGSSHEMGSQYGRLLKKQLEALVFISVRFFPDKMLDRFLKTAFEAEPNLPAETIAFISGMAEASGVNYQKLLAINTVPRTTCSVLAVWGEATADGDLLMGRNADYAFKRINRALGIIVVKHPENGYATVASSFLGLAGTFTGMNEKGVCYGNMLVYNGHEEKGFSNGLPIQLLMQEAAEQQNTARGMIEYLTKKQHVIPINVMCADSTEAVVAELGQKNFAIREGSRGVLAASNLFHSSGMFDEPETDKRFSVLMTKARDYFGIFNSDHMKEAMHAARKPNETLQTVVFEPANMLMHVSMNKVPASKGPFITFDVMELLEK